MLMDKISRTIGVIGLIAMLILTSACNSQATNITAQMEEPNCPDVLMEILNTDIKDHKNAIIFGDESYDIFVPTYSASDFIEFSALSLPDEIDGLEPTPLGMFDEDNYLLMCYPPAGSECSSMFGRYNIKNKSYETIYVAQSNETISIRFFNNRYIVIRAIYDNGRSGEIKILTVDGDVCRSIHKLTIDPVSGYLLNQYSTNNICFDGEYIYFDDMQVNDAGEAYWELYRYNVSSEMCEIIEENAQNPMLYGDSILYFSQNGEGRYNVLSCEDGTDMYEIGLALQSISSNGTNMYCISTPLTCHSDAYTVFELRDLLSNEIILSTKATITDVSAGSRFVSFINFVDDYVFIYDAVNDSLLVADELPKGLHFVYTYGDSGIIVTYTANGVCYFSFRASE